MPTRNLSKNLRLQPGGAAKGSRFVILNGCILTDAMIAMKLVTWQFKSYNRGGSHERKKFY